MDVGHSTRTAVTSKLWEKRLKFQQQQVQQFEGDHSMIDSQIPSHILNKNPTDSLVTVELPFQSDHKLREEYVNFYGDLSFGKLLEDLDACAGNIAHSHADDNNPLTRRLQIVTASVDRIDLLDKLHIDRDMVMRGMVTFVGKSSMEVRIDVESFQNGVWNPILLAAFTMVATFNNKAALVNQLVPETDQQKLLFELGAQNKARRSNMKATSLSAAPPTIEERELIHRIFMETQNLTANEKIEKSMVDMCQTKAQSVCICEPQERNMGNKIFGGWLMREAYTLAWANAHSFCESRPWFLALDQVDFHKPVEIGSILTFNSQVIYSEGHAFCVMVTCDKVTPNQGVGLQKVRTNSFYFTFTCPDKPLSKLVPNTYAEAMQYLDGMRRYKSGKEMSSTLESRLLKFY